MGMSSYMNRCSQCGCTDETRVERWEFDQLKNLISDMVDYIKRDLANDECEQPNFAKYLLEKAEQNGINGNLYANVKIKGNE